MATVTIKKEIMTNAYYDVIVAGGGVAGVAAAVAARRHLKRVLLIEKTQKLGGLATNGIVNCFVPTCNDRGKQIIKSMAQFRTTRHIKGDYTLKNSDVYKHFDDSVAVICDFDRRDFFMKYLIEPCFAVNLII